MTKQILRGAAGILLSCVLIVSGWFFTAEMLSRNERLLLSERGTIKLTLQPPDASGVQATYSPANLAETVHILSVWETQENSKPHEPAVGQLTMEQAVSVGRAWLKALFQDTLPLTVADSKIDAFLCANAPDPSALIEEVPPTLGAIRQESELLPYFSYWTVQFQHNGFHATLMINAVTAEVWRSEIRFAASDLAVDTEIEKMLTAFVAQLTLSDGETLIIDGQNAVHSFENGALLAVAEIQREADTQTLKLYLTTR